MTQPEYLKSKGWRQIGSEHTEVGEIFYWDHPDHQPDERGAFTTQDAAHHQRKLDRGIQCDCIKQPETSLLSPASRSRSKRHRS